MFPAKLRKQLEKELPYGLVINRDIFEKCLVLYPKPEWDKVNTEFMMGAARIDLDSVGRMVIPAILMEFSGIDPKQENEVIVSGLGEKIEIWSMKHHGDQFLSEDDDFGDLAEDVRKDIEDPGRITVL